MNQGKPILRINLGNIKYNYEILKKICTNSDVGAAVKADSYGLGVSQIAPVLLESGCKHFFVANCDEGVELRSIIGNNANIYVFHGVFQDELETFLQYGLVPILNHTGQIEIWQKYASRLNRKLPCFIHIDTGMHRLGMSESQISDLDMNFHASNLEILCLISHLSSAEDIDSDQNIVQLKRFNKLSEKFHNTTKSLANSSGIFLGEEYHFDLVRPGAAIYGINPTPYMNKSIIKPVVSLDAPIIQISSLPVGESLGYNAAYTNKGTSSCLIATIPVGYADGFLRHFSNKGKVIIDGYEASIIGKVSMDLTIIDVSQVPENSIYLGQKVQVLGENLTADTISTLCGTIGYEILTSLGSRYERVYS
jgi:alanine racemase